MKWSWSKPKPPAPKVETPRTPVVRTVLLQGKRCRAVRVKGDVLHKTGLCNLWVYTDTVVWERSDRDATGKRIWVPYPDRLVTTALVGDLKKEMDDDD